MQKEIWEKILDSIDVLTPDEYHDLCERAKQMESIVLLESCFEEGEVQQELRLVYEIPIYGVLTSVELYDFSPEILDITSDKRIQTINSLTITPAESYYNISDNLTMCV